MIFKKAMIGAAMSLFTGAAFAAPLTIPTDVNLRWGPGLEYPVQLVVPEGTVVDVQRCADFWCEVSVDEYQGFMNRDVIGLGDTGPLPPQAFAQGPQPIFVPAFDDYYYDDDYGYAYGPGFGFRYYGGFHGRFNSRQARHSRQESRQRIHRTIVSALSVHNPAVSARAGHNRARSQAFTHNRAESAALRQSGDRNLLKQRLQNQQNVIRTQKQKTQILQQRNQQQQQENFQQRNLQKQKTIINRQENVQPRVLRQQQFKQKTITQPNVQRRIQQPNVQRNIQQPKVQRSIQQQQFKQRTTTQPTIQRNIQRPQIQNRPAVQRSAPARAAPKAVPNVQKKKN